MEIVIKGSAKEIAALAVEVQERQIERHEQRDAVRSAQETHDLLCAIRRVDRLLAERAKQLGVPLPAFEESTDKA